jgi:hypothetical protein
MAAEAQGNGDDTRAQDRAGDGAWSIDWDAVPMAQLVDEAPAKPAAAPRKRRLNADEAPPAKAAAAPPPGTEAAAAPPPPAQATAAPPPPAQATAAPPPPAQATAAPPPPAQAAAAPSPPAPTPTPAATDTPSPRPPRERLRPPVHPTVVPALDDLVRPPAASSRNAAPPPPPAAPPAAEDIAAPLPSLPPMPPGASEPELEPKQRRWRRRSAPTLADAPTLPQATGGRRRRRGRVTPIRAIALLALTIACAVGGYLISQMTDGDTPTPAADSATPVQGQSSASPSASTPPAADRPVDKRTLYPADVAFVSSGVRFTVVPDPVATWAREVEATDPGEGLRWELVSVLYRNLSRERLLAEDLRFRLKDGANNVFAPVPGAGNGGSDLPAQTPIPIGTLVKGHLAFQVPTPTANLSLIIDPDPQARARVLLESG